MMEVFGLMLLATNGAPISADCIFETPVYLGLTSAKNGVGWPSWCACMKLVLGVFWFGDLMMDLSLLPTKNEASMY